ncbi:RNA exonuclease 3 [Penicillium subrubescens]|uniref:RNA exonuclease 3 n=1 Tax=Penicillium subrubescens TaxID=1316194 RepID=A0A1Q5TFK0_9EURO|nr:RNA exonuclease 3 [Penicillium subrubescens]KAJ5891776.1 RNA exonuclease 3 [Penicillium subrubescens]OKO99003.1 RNA exonuclease 3 [Penicillium subrubescens]
MFSTLGLFTGVACPQGEHCPLLACMFSHTRDLTVMNQASSGTKTTSKVVDTHTQKKLKIQASISTTDSSSLLHNASCLGNTAKASASKSRPSQQSPRRTSGQAGSQTLTTPQGASTSPSRSTSKPERGEPSSVPVAPQTISSQLPPRKVRKESLNPRMLTKAPAPHGTRSAILKKLHSVMVSQNEKLAKSKENSNKCFVLAADELVTMALDEEEGVAKGSPGVYSNVIKLRIVKLTKMSLAEWAKEVMEHLNTRYYKVPVAPTPDAPKRIETGLTTEQEIAVALRLITPLDGLEEFGYVTKAPTEAEVETAKQGVIDSKGWEKCERCASRFQVFPGRREDGALTTGGQCTYHPSRPIIPARKKTDNYTGASDPYFPCCSESIGASVGCTKGTHHVFKISESKRLASILQFETTPQQPDKGVLDPVCFDCEMGYTTQGMELIRLTAVSWPEGRELLDILVKPIGEVLDLNSRFSGVYPEHFANAIPYGTSDAILKSPPRYGQGEEKQKHMQVVESPAEARKLLFRFLQPETPLIGHAIENDLNVCRIIHPTIIDTVILYPAPRGGLPNRMSLKALARKFLSRDIQTGGAKGHDSKEDAVTTGDLVRAMVRDSWKTYERNGWHFEGDEMVSPPNQENYYVNRQGIYVPGQGPHANAKSVQERIELSDTGQKRKQPSTDDSAA